jgi:PAS domain S-box-containing protein
MKNLAAESDTPTSIQAFLDHRVLDLPDRLLDLLPVGVYVCDRDGLIVRYNRAAAELWGSSPEIGDPTVRYCGSYRLYRVDGEYLPHAKCPMADVLATGQGLRDQEVAIERPDGERIVALVNIDAIRDDSGRVIGAVNVFRETPKPRADQFFENGGVRDSDQILLGLPAAVYTTDAAGRITFYNEAAVELWGVRPKLGTSEFCGSWKLYRPDGTPLPHDQCPMALALREKRPIRGMEAIAERPDGTRVPFIPYPTPLFDSAGALIGAVNTLVDITERHAAERRIRESELHKATLAAIVESSADAILTKDLNGVITSWNRAAERLFGYTAEEAIGKPVTLLFPKDRYDEEPAILERIRRGERIEHYDTVRQRKDGTLIDISLSISPVRDAQGEIICASKIARDISERKRAEERQRLLLREMDHRVKNLFVLAGGVVDLSARSATTAKELAAAVNGRLAALAKGHALTLRPLSENNQSTQNPATLHALIETILSPYDGRTDDGVARFAISGPDLPLAGRSVTSFALLLHEFATNAAKYGGLSTDRGAVAIDCLEDDVRFAVTWSERGGPSVEHQIDGDGFGAFLIRATVKDQLGGEISQDWKPEGLTIRLSVSKDRVAAG